MLRVMSQAASFLGRGRPPLMAPWAPWALRGVRASACTCPQWGRPLAGLLGVETQPTVRAVPQWRWLWLVCRVAWSQVWSQTSGRSLPASRSASQNPQSAGSPLEDRPQASLHQTQGIWGGGRQLLHLRSCWRRGGHLPRKAQRERCPRAAGSGVGLGGAPESDRVGSSGPAMPPTGCVTLDKSLHLSVPPRAHL